MDLEFGLRQKMEMQGCNMKIRIFDIISKIKYESLANMIQRNTYNIEEY